MTTDQTGRTRTGRLALLALPVLCCLGHAVLLGLGIASLSAASGVITGSPLLVAAGVVLAAAAVAALVRQSRHQ